MEWCATDNDLANNDGNRALLHSTRFEYTLLIKVCESQQMTDESSDEKRLPYVLSPLIFQFPISISRLHLTHGSFFMYVRVFFVYRAGWRRRRAGVDFPGIFRLQ
jgi:hypothetical protein